MRVIETEKPGNGMTSCHNSETKVQNINNN